MKKTITPANGRLKKRPIFGDEDEDDEKESKPKFKKPTLDLAEIEEKNLKNLLILKSTSWINICCF